MVDKKIVYRPFIKIGVTYKFVSILYLNNLNLKACKKLKIIHRRDTNVSLLFNLP